MQNIAISFAALVTASIVVWVGVRYCTKVIRRQINATVTTWIIFEIGVVMSLATYFTSHNHSIVKAINNTSDGFVVTAVLATLLIKGRGKKITFSDNEKLCLKIAIASLVMWALTRTSWIGFAGFQVVMIVAYFPMFENLWRWEPGNPPEPADMWSITALVSAIGVWHRRHGHAPRLRGDALSSESVRTLHSRSRPYSAMEEKEFTPSHHIDLMNQRVHQVYFLIKIYLFVMRPPLDSTARNRRSPDDRAYKEFETGFYNAPPRGSVGQYFGKCHLQIFHLRTDTPCPKAA